jgi:hypothetical protein
LWFKLIFFLIILLYQINKDQYFLTGTNLLFLIFIYYLQRMRKFIIITNYYIRNDKIIICGFRFFRTFKTEIDINKIQKMYLIKVAAYSHNRDYCLYISYNHYWAPKYFESYYYFNVELFNKKQIFELYRAINRVGIKKKMKTMDYRYNL